MSLSIKDRALILNEQNFCPNCAGKHDANTACSVHWVSVKRPPSLRCRYRDENSNEQCSYHVVLCTSHAAYNHKELKSITDRLGLPRYPVPDHEETGPTVHPTSRKPPFTYTVKTDNNELTQVMVDPGATLSILRATKTAPSATGAKHGDSIFGTVSKWFNKKRENNTVIAIKAGVAEPEVDTQNDPDFVDHKNTPGENIQVRQSSRNRRPKSFGDFVQY